MFQILMCQFTLSKFFQLKISHSPRDSWLRRRKKIKNRLWISITRIKCNLISSTKFFQLRTGRSRLFRVSKQSSGHHMMSRIVWNFPLLSSVWLTLTTLDAFHCLLLSRLLLLSQQLVILILLEHSQLSHYIQKSLQLWHNREFLMPLFYASVKLFVDHTDSSLTEKWASLAANDDIYTTDRRWRSRNCLAPILNDKRN